MKFSMSFVKLTKVGSTIVDAAHAAFREEVFRKVAAFNLFVC